MKNVDALRWASDKEIAKNQYSHAQISWSAKIKLFFKSGLLIKIYKFNK